MNSAHRVCLIQHHWPHRLLQALWFGALCVLLALAAGCASDNEETFLSEGSSASPVALGSTFPISHEGTVGSAGSYYLATVTNPTAYVVTVSGFKGDVDLFVYGVSGFSTSPVLCVSASSSAASESCTATADGTSLHIFLKFTGDDTENIDSTELLLSVSLTT